MSISEFMKARAPGKLILSGEHAVVYGKPALAVAINRYAEAEATSQLAPIISFDFGDLAYQQALRYAALERIKEFKIREVVQKPVELAQFALSLFFEILNVRPKHGVKIKVRSDIPIGCGMGSSAAIILSVIHAIAHHMGVNISPELFFRLGLEAENMQHGRSSGLDLRVSQEGGCLLAKAGQIIHRPIPQIPFYLVNTGAPVSTTGECVSAAAAFFKDNQLGDEFAAVTEMMDQALQANDKAVFCDAVCANQKLLEKIGVVPNKVQEFVAKLAKVEGAAKICGAGSVAGDNAGVLMVVIDDVLALTELCAQYRYNLLPIAPEARGVHVV
jgi:mevalonate kinase